MGHRSAKIASTLAPQEKERIRKQAKRFSFTLSDFARRASLVVAERLEGDRPQEILVEMADVVNDPES